MVTSGQTEPKVRRDKATGHPDRGCRESYRPNQPGGPQPVMDWTLGDVNAKSQALIIIGTLSSGLVTVFGTTFLFFTRMDYALPFAAITGASWAGLQFWRTLRGSGLPLLALLLIQQALIYGTPLIVSNPTVENYSAEVLFKSSLAVLVSVPAACVGWWLGSASMKTAPSRFILAIHQPGTGIDRTLSLGVTLLFSGTAFDAMGVSGLIWKLLPATWPGFYPILRTFGGAANSLGALLGGIALASPGSRTLRLVFWLLFWTEFFLSIRDTLLSGAMTLVLGLIVGLAIGRRRIPWRFLLVTAFTIAFLNFGKFPMREKYSWDGNSLGPSFRALPSFYLEWVNESLRLLNLKQFGGNQLNILAEGEKGQSMLMRLDNLQNLLFIVDALESGGAEPLYGKTYSLIPKLLVPRFIWPDKPRTHEGQVLLNIYYGRQSTVEETERTYVAWGLLPEAVGNFGFVWGPIGFGLIAGLVCGIIETWSIQKKLLSLEGLLCLTFLMQLANSFEMVASVFVTSTFQLACAVSTAGLAVYFWLQREPGRMRTRSRRVPVIPRTRN